MISETYPHNRLQRVLWNRFVRRAYFVVVASGAILACTLFSAPKYALAKVLDQQITDSSISAGQDNGTLQQILGTGMDFTATGVTMIVSAKDSFGGKPRIRILCFDTPTYTPGNLNAGCSSTTFDYGSVPPTSATSITISTSSFVFNPAKYYSILFDCWTGCSGVNNYYFGSTTDVYSYGDAEVFNTSGGQSVGSVKDFYFVIQGTGTSRIPADVFSNALTILTNPPYVMGLPINFNVSWFQNDFDVFYEEFYKDTNQPQYHYNLGNNFNLGSSNNLNFYPSYVNSGSYLPAVKLGNSFCTGASNTGALTGVGCQYVTLSTTIIVLSTDQFIRGGSGSSPFQWVGGNMASGIYSPVGSGSVFYPTNKVGTPASKFSWVAGTGSIYYQNPNITSTGSLGVGVIGAEGIFGTNIFSFQGFGTTNNTFLNLAQGLLLIVVYAALWVAQRMFDLLQLSSIFSFILGVLHPLSGSVHTMPTTIFGIHNPFFAGQSFTVSYVANSGNAQNVTKLVQLSTIISVFVLVLNQFLFSRKK